MENFTAQQLTAIRSIKKTAIVLMIMLNLDHNTNAKEISEILKVKEDTAGRYMKDLKSLNLITHHGKFSGYSLNMNSIQVMLPQMFELLENPKKGDYLATTTYLNKNKEKVRKEVVVIDLINNVENPDNGDFLIKENLQALRQSKIKGKTADHLAQLPHVTPSYIYALSAGHQQEKGHRKGIGLLIQKIKDADEAPEIKENGHLVSCNCDRCFRSYSDSKYTIQIDDEAEIEIIESERGSHEWVWDGIKDHFRMEMNKAVFDTWIAETKSISLEDGKLIVQTENEYGRDWLEDRIKATVDRMIIVHPGYEEVCFVTSWGINESE